MKKTTAFGTLGNWHSNVLTKKRNPLDVFAHIKKKYAGRHGDALGQSAVGFRLSGVEVPSRLNPRPVNVTVKTIRVTNKANTIFVRWSPDWTMVARTHHLTAVIFTSIPIAMPTEIPTEIITVHALTR